MAFLRRELHRHIIGPEVAREDRCVLVFDTVTKRLYVEHQSADSDARIDGTSARNNRPTTNFKCFRTNGFS